MSDPIGLIGGYSGLSNGVIGDLELKAARASAAANPLGTIETLIASDLGAFVSGRFSYSFGDFFSYAILYDRGIEGHSVELIGNVTHVTTHLSGPSVQYALNPEPTTLVPAGIAVVVAVGSAWRRRKAKPAS